MTLLDRYLIRTIFAYSALVMGVLMVLGGLFLFMGQQDDIGVGSYGTVDALVFSLLNLPQQLYELMPVGVLLGCLLGLGMLARGSELIVIRASGVSVARIAGAVAVGGGAIMLLTAVMGELVAPPLQKFARQQKVFAKFTGVSVAGAAGAWVKDGETMISVQEQSGSALFGDVYVFRFKNPRELASVASAARAVVEGRGWHLERYAETRFEDDRVIAERKPAATLEMNVNPGFLGLARSQPRQMPSYDLWRLIGHLRANGLETGAYEFAFWSRIARTCAIVLVALLALPFVFGPLRSAGAGARFMVGALIGIGFFLLQRTLESGAVVFDVNPVVLAWLPTAVLALLTGMLIFRTR